MDQQVGTQQEARDVAAALEEPHIVTEPQCGALQLEYLGVVLADYKQPGAFSQFGWQRGQGLEAAIHALGLEPGTDLHQQQVVLGQLEFGPERRADLVGVGRPTAVLGDARWQQVKALQRRAVMLDEQWLLDFGDCLLYTSPSPRDRTRSRMPSSA